MLSLSTLLPFELTLPSFHTLAALLLLLPAERSHQLQAPQSDSPVIERRGHPCPNRFLSELIQPPIRFPTSNAWIEICSYCLLKIHPWLAAISAT